MAKPDWIYWNNLADLELHEAVELSCDIVPGTLEDDSRWVRADMQEIVREFHYRMNIAVSHTAAQTLHVTRRGIKEFVRLVEFRSWGESLPTPLTFPAEFAESEMKVVDATLPPAQSDKPLDTRERTTLLCIIGALASGAKVDLAEPYKAGEVVAKMLPDGVKLMSRTIGDHLKNVHEALESRRT